MNALRPVDVGTPADFCHACRTGAFTIERAPYCETHQRQYDTRPISVPADVYAELRIDLARMTMERDEARSALNGIGEKVGAPLGLLGLPPKELAAAYAAQWLLDMRSSEDVEREQLAIRKAVADADVAGFARGVALALKELEDKLGDAIEDEETEEAYAIEDAIERVRKLAPAAKVEPKSAEGRS